jgi:hypothetical protein
MRQPWAAAPVLIIAMAVTVALGACRDTPAAPGLSATCSATPDAGPAPLVVRFVLNVAGAQGRFDVAVRYGDGATGDDVTAPHTYAAAGSYSAAFDVTTSTQSALCTTVVRVEVASATPGPRATPRPTPGGPNQAPSAVFRTTPAATLGEIVGRGSLAVELNMCRTADPEQDPLSFTMDFEGDGNLEVSGSTGGDCRRTRTYGVGTYRPRICVTDLNSGLAPAHPYQCRSYTVRIVSR